MPGFLAAALLVAAAAQSTPANRTRAEQLARAGHSEEALALFERIVSENPADVEARLWVARLDLRLERNAKAEAEFRAVFNEHPEDVDARIGLAKALTRRGSWEEALAILTATERDAGENADLFAALGRAYRHAGDDRRGLAYFRRAKAVAPTDPDVADGYESAVAVYRHSLAVEGFGEEAGTSTAGSISLTGTVRTTPKLVLEGLARTQRRGGATDVLGGGGFRWRAGRTTDIGVRVAGGSGNVSLANLETSVAAVRYTGAYEFGAALRFLSYASASVAAVSPAFAWDPGGRWRLDSRYTFSRVRFDSIAASNGDQSVLLRGTWRGWRRVGLSAGYAYGIESFEKLTADRLASLGAHTAAAGLAIRAPSLTRVFVTWEHQWRSNGTRMDRITLALVQTFP